MAESSSGHYLGKDGYEVTGGKDYKGVQRKLLEVMDMFTTLIVLMMNSVYMSKLIKVYIYVHIYAVYCMSIIPE